MTTPPPPTDHAVYGADEEDLDEEDDYEEDQNDDDDDADVEVDVDEDSTSSAELPDPLPSSAGQVTVAVAGVAPLPELKQTPESSSSMALTVRKPLPLPLDESRKLFQRLWTDEDEIELLQGFLEYTVQRGYNNSSSNHHHDTTAFYDQIKSKLQLEFNKNQLVEKLRRLKKKYRNVVSKLNSGKDYVFKTPHDQATFDISKKIWGGAGLDEDEANPNPNPNLNMNFSNSNIAIADHNVNGGIDVNNNNFSHISSEKKPVRPRKRSRASVKIEEKQHNTVIDQSPVTPQVLATPLPSVPNLIEDTVRSCLSPLFKELLNNAMAGSRGGAMPLNSMMMPPMGIGGGSFNFGAGLDVDDKWRKQQILELEVFSKRLELMQDQIKSQLEELRSLGS